jgi:hypothetical protein
MQVDAAGAGRTSTAFGAPVAQEQLHPVSGPIATVTRVGERRLRVGVSGAGVAAANPNNAIMAIAEAQIFMTVDGNFQVEVLGLVVEFGPLGVVLKASLLYMPPCLHSVLVRRVCMHIFVSC